MIFTGIANFTAPTQVFIILYLTHHFNGFTHFKGHFTFRHVSHFIWVYYCEPELQIILFIGLQSQYFEVRIAQCVPIIDFR